MKPDQQRPSNEAPSRFSSSKRLTKGTFDLLPYELMAHVFTLGCPRFDPRFQSFKPTPPNSHWPEDPLPYQLLVASVCHRWRQVALETPQLWSSIFVNLAFIDSRPRITTPNTLQLIEERSGTVDLFLCITASMSDDPILDIVPIIVRLLPRAYALAIDVFNDCHVGSNVFPLGNVPRLRHFSLNYSFDYDCNPAPEDIFKGPIYLDSFQFYPSNDIPDVTVENCLKNVATRSLTYLPPYATFDVDARQDIIHTSRALKKLHLLYRIIFPSSIMHPTLSTLRLTAQEQYPTLACLGSLPELTHLAFDRTECNASWGREPSSRPLPALNVFPKLRTLVVKVTDVTRAGYPDTWDHVEGVVSLIKKLAGACSSRALEQGRMGGGLTAR